MRRTTSRTILPGLILALLGTAAWAECAPESAAEAAAIAKAWSARDTAAAPAVADDAAARCVQAALVEALEPEAGPPVGWKVGLTSQAAQAQFGVDHPVAGRLLEGMILESGATVARDFGGRPIAEADLLVSVGDAGIMEATTPEQALAHLASLQPFIELADLVVAPGAPLSADAITAINVGARSGVAGPAVPLEAADDWFAMLTTMTVRIADADGTILGEYPGNAILGHPLNAVVWLVERLKAGGETLQPGDLISLGSFGPPLPPAELGGLTVTYLGLPLPEAPSVSVVFE